MNACEPGAGNDMGQDSGGACIWSQLGGAPKTFPSKHVCYKEELEAPEMSRVRVIVSCYSVRDLGWFIANYTMVCNVLSHQALP